MTRLYASLKSVTPARLLLLHLPNRSSALQMASETKVLKKSHGARTAAAANEADAIAEAELREVKMRRTSLSVPTPN